MKRVLTLGIFCAFVLSCVACENEGNKNERRRGSGHRHQVAQAESVEVLQ